MKCQAMVIIIVKRGKRRASLGAISAELVDSSQLKLNERNAFRTSPPLWQ